MAKNEFLVQYAAGICATLTIIPQGMGLAWASPAIPKLLNGESGVVFTEAQCSWVASIINIGAIVGCFVGQYLTNAIGRKKIIILSNIPIIIAMLMVALVESPWPLCIARFLLGIGAGLATVIVSIYTAEISDKEIRGALGTLLMTMWIFGNLLMYTIGPYVSYSMLNYICLCISVVILLACSWIPESPYYYLKINDIENAKKELMKLKRLKTIEPAQDELMNIQKHIKLDMERKTSIIELLTKKDYRKGVIIIGGLKIMQIASGGMVIQTYLESIFLHMQLTLSSGLGSIIYGVVQLMAGLVGMSLVDRMGRRPLLLTSSTGAGLSLLSIGIYFYMQDVAQIPAETLSSVSWIPVAGILAFVVFYSIGIGTLPYVLQSEVFPNNVKSAASAVGSIFGAIMAFVTVKAYHVMVKELGAYTVYWIFAGIVIIGIFFVYFKVPETKGKTLEEINMALKGEVSAQLSEIKPLQNK